MVWALIGLSGLGLGCRTVGTLPSATRAQLEQRKGGYLSGEVAGLEEFKVLNNTDFVYSIAVSKDGNQAAFTHLGAKSFQLGLWTLEGQPRQLADATLNALQYDVEGLAFSPDGKVVATVGRDGWLRLFNVESGATAGVYETDEPLVSVALHPEGKYLVLGSAKGLITVLEFPSLQFAVEVRALRDEVRSLAFSAEGVLYAGGWDKSIVAFDLRTDPESVDSARLRVERRGGLAMVRGTVNAKVPATFAFDERVPYVIIGSEVAKAAGIDLVSLKDSVTLATAMGSTVARVALRQSLAFKSVRLSEVDLVVCDLCLPAGAQGVLGAAFFERYRVSFDELAAEALLTAQETQAGRVPVLSLAVRKAMTFDWYVNDFSLDRSGRHLGVAFSEVKAERNREVYEREKKGVVEPRREGNAGAIVDAQTGQILKKWTEHEGVVSTAAISPDGRTLATGGWDKHLCIQDPDLRTSLKRDFGWSVRRVRFSDDGRFLVVAAWTPQNALGDHASNPSATVFELQYRAPEVQSAP